MNRTTIILAAASTVALAALAGWKFFGGYSPPEDVLPTAIRGDAPDAPAPDASADPEIPQVVSAGPNLGPAAPQAAPLRESSDSEGPDPAAPEKSDTVSNWVFEPLTEAANLTAEQLRESAGQWNEKWWFHQTRGELELSKRNTVAAEAAFRRVVELAPQRASGYVGLAAVAAIDKEFGRARSLLATALDKNPQSVPALYNRAVLHMREGELHDAKRRLRDVVRIKPDHVRANYNLASIESHFGHLTQAAYWWEKVVALAPAMSNARYNLGLVYLQQEHYGRAIEQFESVLIAQPRSADAMNNLGLAWQGKGDLKKALAYYHQAFEHQPLDVTIINNLADLHLVLHRNKMIEQEHLKKAMTLWRASLAIQPRQPRLRELLAYYSTIALPATQPDE